MSVWLHVSLEFSNARPEHLHLVPGVFPLYSIRFHETTHKMLHIYHLKEGFVEHYNCGSVTYLFVITLNVDRLIIQKGERLQAMYLSRHAGDTVSLVLKLVELLLSHICSQWAKKSKLVCYWLLYKAFGQSNALNQPALDLWMHRLHIYYKCLLM